MYLCYYMLVAVFYFQQKEPQTDQRKWQCPKCKAKNECEKNECACGFRPRNFKHKASLFPDIIAEDSRIYHDGYRFVSEALR